MEDYKVDHEDVFMRLFFHSLKEDAREWFSSLLPHSINSWVEFQAGFREQFGERIYGSSILIDFMEIHIEEDELVLDFNL